MNIMKRRYMIDRASTARAKQYMSRFLEDVKAAGSIAEYMAGPTFHRSEPTSTQDKEKK